MDYNQTLTQEVEEGRKNKTNEKRKESKDTNQRRDIQLYDAHKITHSSDSVAEFWHVLRFISRQWLDNVPEKDSYTTGQANVRYYTLTQRARELVKREKRDGLGKEHEEEEMKNKTEFFFKTIGQGYPSILFQCSVCW